VAACGKSQAARQAVEASMELGTDIGIDQTPVLVVNGHILPMGGLPYEVLKKIIAYQATQDGIAVHVQPSLTTLK
jgi:predicted DsbA family dithiol-disulfide isomerase